ncbi:hypothetical protein DFH09DRAFT_1167092 [Mycena vulgaris]|nr:hypothetical protein DFH09DRAFT_1167092 [Mycena vulgaris]
MFSKLLKFGLCALTLTLAAAAPSQQVSISCAISQSGTSLLGSKGIERGVYRIVNEVGEGVLKAYRPFTPVLISKNMEFPVTLQQWRVEPTEEGNYRFVNLQYNMPIIHDKGTLILAPGPSPAAEFALDPAEGDTFIVKVPNEDDVWTVSYPDAFTSMVQLRGANGEEAQRWKFIKLDLD